MSKKNNGGQAFPGGCERGMSMRDYFAAKAMAALLSGEYYQLQLIRTKARARGESMESVIASEAYAAADAMLVERAK